MFRSRNRSAVVASRKDRITPEHHTTRVSCSVSSPGACHQGHCRLPPLGRNHERRGLDPLRWTSSERWIRCPAWSRARSRSDRDSLARLGQIARPRHDRNLQEDLMSRSNEEEEDQIPARPQGVSQTRGARGRGARGRRRRTRGGRARDRDAPGNPGRRNPRRRSRRRCNPRRGRPPPHRSIGISILCRRPSPP